MIKKKELFLFSHTFKKFDTKLIFTVQYQEKVSFLLVKRNLYDFQCDYQFYLKFFFSSKFYRCGFRDKMKFP